MGGDPAQARGCCGFGTGLPEVANRSTEEGRKVFERKGPQVRSVYGWEWVAATGVASGVQGELDERRGEGDSCGSGTLV